MLEVYEVFSKDWSHTHRFDEEAAVELFNHESYGKPLTPLNGYALGKKWMDVFLAMWRQDIEEGNLFKFELYTSGEFPEWWLDKVLENMQPKIFALGTENRAKASYMCIDKSCTKCG